MEAAVFFRRETVSGNDSAVFFICARFRTGLTDHRVHL